MMKMMNTKELIDPFELQIRRVCSLQARYRVLWLVGQPRSGKTRLARTVCERNGWQYINFTLDSGYLDRLVGSEEIYRPDDFLSTLRRLCANTDKEIIVIDQIEPLLGLWSWQWQDLFFKKIGRATRLKAGVVLVTRLRTRAQLARLVPNANHVFEMPEGEKR